jgi:hypothetical protein
MVIHVSEPMLEVGGILSAYNKDKEETVLIRAYGVSGVQAYFTAGNVGVGTSTPTAGLEISNDEGLKIQSKVDGGYKGNIKMVDAFNNSTSRDDMLFSTAGGFMFKMDDNNNGVSTVPGFSVYNSDNNCVFAIKESTGDVTVDGKVTSTEVEVKTDVWPDFVFEPTYTLKPLEEVEQFILTNKHLPDVPSEKEVKENGLSLGQSDAVLLQKIEELTLYLIEQNKENKEQSEKIKELEEENKKLKAELEQFKKFNEKLIKLEKQIEKLNSNN